jgi:hypothetical protein
MADKEDNAFNKELSEEFIDVDKIDEINNNNDYIQFINLINLYIYSINKRIIISQNNYIGLIKMCLK